MLNLKSTSLILTTTLTLGTAIFTPTVQAKVPFSSANNPNLELQSQFPGIKASSDTDMDFSSIPELNLTEEQKTQLREFQANLGSRLSEILTEDQLESFRTAIQSGESPREVAGSLNLSFRQKREMRKLMQWQKKQLKSILDDEQRETLKKIRETRDRTQGQIPFSFKQG